ncbi:GntR family transcriptional regulator [Streptosporangium sp. NPDC002524]|uniref:GntR family transcriptional regulator n=1 Tax=Streptosporangium sp. NPDC002524 TaxID=3154537 RepID=UPI00331A059F
MGIEPPRSNYRQLADLLRSAIHEGTYEPGATLPSEPELAAQYRLSRPTVNRAILILRNEGLVRVERGRGTFVREIPPINRHATTRYPRASRERDGLGRGAFDTEIRDMGLKPRSEVVQLEPVVPPERVAHALRLTDDQLALVRKRHMFASDAPIQVATSWVPWSIAEGTPLERRDTGPGGTYSRLAELGHEVARFTEAVAVRTPTREEETFLRLTEEQPLFDIFHIAWDANDRPVEVTVHVMPTFQWVLNYEWPAEPQ